MPQQTDLVRTRRVALEAAAKHFPWLEEDGFAAGVLYGALDDSLSFKAIGEWTWFNMEPWFDTDTFMRCFREAICARARVILRQQRLSRGLPG